MKSPKALTEEALQRVAVIGVGTCNIKGNNPGSRMTTTLWEVVIQSNCVTIKTGSTLVDPQWPSGRGELERTG